MDVWMMSTDGTYDERERKKESRNREIHESATDRAAMPPPTGVGPMKAKHDDSTVRPKPKHFTPEEYVQDEGPARIRVCTPTRATTIPSDGTLLPNYGSALSSAVSALPCRRRSAAPGLAAVEPQ